MNMKTDAELLEYFAKTRRIQPITLDSYKIFTKQYAELNGMTMCELIQEAEEEEEQGIRWAKRTLRKRLLEYRSFLYDNYSLATAKARFSKMKAFYKHFAIEIHDFPMIADINTEKSHMRFQDLPTKSIIKKALKIAKPVMRCIILFMSSSGSAKAETRSLTIQSFINAINNEIYSYCDSDDIYEIIRKLQGRKDIVPLFTLKRIKTNKSYYTFCSPEATMEILDYLATREKLKPEDPLFDISYQLFSTAFEEINDKLGLGRLENGRRRFTSHMLRKYHASQLYAAKVPMEIVDTLQGRGKDQTHSSYFYENPLSLKEVYVEHVSCLVINFNITKIDMKSKEYIELENKNKELEEENLRYQELVESLDERIERKVQEAINNSPGLSAEEFNELFS